jgi:hypothetical protein
LKRFPDLVMACPILSALRTMGKRSIRQADAKS